MNTLEVLVAVAKVIEEDETRDIDSTNIGQALFEIDIAASNWNCSRLDAALELLARAQRETDKLFAN